MLSPAVDTAGEAVPGRGAEAGHTRAEAMDAPLVAGACAAEPSGAPAAPGGDGAAPTARTAEPEGGPTPDVSLLLATPPGVGTPDNVRPPPAPAAVVQPSAAPAVPPGPAVGSATQRVRAVVAQRAAQGGARAPVSSGVLQTNAPKVCSNRATAPCSHHRSCPPRPVMPCSDRTLCVHVRTCRGRGNKRWCRACTERQRWAPCATPLTRGRWS